METHVGFMNENHALLQDAGEGCYELGIYGFYRVRHNPLSSGHWNGDSFETLFALHHNSLMLQNAVLRSHSFIKLSFLCEESTLKGPYKMHS